MLTNYKVDLDAIATSFVNALPKLDSFEQHLSIELYRLLAGGQPVPCALLAKRVGVVIEKINPILKTWPGVFFDSQDQVVGYWGLSLPASYESPHKMTIDGQTLSAWCEGVKQANPADAQMSFLLPDAESTQKDILSAFCCFVHFFPSRKAGENWVAQHDGTFLLSIEQGLAVAHRKNMAQYGNVLQ